MEINENPLALPPETKVVLSLRIDPGYKMRLSEHARALNISLGEYVEYRLLKSDDMSKDSRIKELEIEVQRLRSSISQYQQLEAIASHPYLLEMFNQVKGKSDTIVCPGGKSYLFKYNSVIDFLKGMIYSFKLKK